MDVQSHIWSFSIYKTTGINKASQQKDIFMYAKLCVYRAFSFKQKD